MKELVVNNKKISIYGNNSSKQMIPVIILNSFQEEGKEIFEKCKELQAIDFILVSISNLNWNQDLTPWKSLALFGSEEFKGKADDYLEELESEILPKVEETIKTTLKKSVSYYGIVGYSLAGLFALYTGFKTDKFQRIASISGSLWYPHLEPFIQENTLSKNIDKVYFSLGKKEKNSKNNYLSTIEEKTKAIENIISQKVRCKYEENHGNHFQDVVLRIAKGITWILKEGEQKGWKNNIN